MSPFANENKEAVAFLKKMIANKNKIIFSAVIGVLGAIFVTAILPVKYSSTAIIYPINSFAKNDLMVNPQFGGETDVDRLLQVIESSYIRDQVIKKFDLLQYYKIDTSALDWKNNLITKYTNNISFTKSRYLSVIIAAEMQDPKLAAEIVNGIIDMVNKFQKQLYMKNVYNEIFYKEKVYKKQVSRTDSLLKEIYRIKNPQMPLNIIYNHLLSVNNQISSSEATKFVDSPLMEQLVNNYKFEQSRLDEIRGDYEKSKLLAQRPFPDVFVIDYGQPSNKKLSSFYFLNITIGFFASVFIAVFLILFKEKAKHLLTGIEEQNEN